MMIILRDDGMIETHLDERHPPSWMEWVDIQNDEYKFCDECGQIYQGAFDGIAVLIPQGKASLENIVSMIDSATGIDHRRSIFTNLDELKSFVHIKSSGEK